MSELEKKFKEYYEDKRFRTKDWEEQLHDLAEIAEKENTKVDMLYMDLCKTFSKPVKENTDYKEMNKILDDSRNKIVKENTELKKRINAMKDIIKTLEHDVKFWKDKSRGLAIPITKEKIINKYKKCDLVLISGKKLVLRKREILGDKFD